jgi:hypothetical protein
MKQLGGMHRSGGDWVYVVNGVNGSHLRLYANVSPAWISRKWPERMFLTRYLTGSTPLVRRKMKEAGLDSKLFYFV